MALRNGEALRGRLLDEGYPDEVGRVEGEANHLTWNLW